MTARIKTATAFYDSVIFAIGYNGFSTWVIAFDEGLNALKRIFMYKNTLRNGIKRTVFVIDAGREGWTEKKKNLCGFDWLINDNASMKRIKAGKAIDEAVLGKCKALQSEMSVREWNEIHDEKDAESLLNAAWEFHDSTIEKIERKADSVEVTFSGCWGCRILLRAEGEPSWRGEEECGHLGKIFEAEISFENNFVFWNTDDGNARIKAKKMFWKIILD